MLHYLVQLNYATVIVILFMLVFVKANRFFDKKITRIFCLAILAIFVLVVVDSIEYWTASLERPGMLRILMSALGYSLRPTIIYMVAVLVTRSKNSRRLLMALPLGINTVISFSALFTDVAFSYSETNEFIRGPLGYTPFVISGFYLVLLLVLTIKVYKNENNTEALIAITVLCMCTLATIMESVLKYDGLINATGAVSVTFYYLYLNTQQFKRDSLTNVLNRRCFYLDAEKNGNTLTAIISIDLNNLKQLNDGKGHAEGDKAICTMVGCINKVLLRGCYLYRTGGDEFMILCFRQDRNAVTQMIEKVRIEMEKTPYSCAIGKTFVDTCENFEKLCAEADKEMYKDKIRMKKALEVIK